MTIRAARATGGGHALGADFSRILVAEARRLAAAAGAGLTVREVLAHLTAGASLNPVRWLAGMIRCRFDFGKQVAMRLAEQLGATPAETMDRFRSVLTSTTKPPLPTLAMLGETIVHAEDIRLPLGIRTATRSRPSPG